MSKTNYTSPNKLFKAVPTDLEGMFTIHKMMHSQCFPIGVLDAEAGKFRPTHTDESLSISAVKDLHDLMEALQKKFGDNG